MTYDSSGHTLLLMLISSSLNYNNRDVTFTSSFFTLQSCQCQKPLVFVKEMLIKIALGFARSLIKLREELLVIFEGLIILLHIHCIIVQPVCFLEVARSKDYRRRKDLW